MKYNGKKVSILVLCAALVVSSEVSATVSSMLATVKGWFKSTSKTAPATPAPAATTVAVLNPAAVSTIQLPMHLYENMAGTATIAGVTGQDQGTLRQYLKTAGHLLDQLNSNSNQVLNLMNKAISGDKTLSRPLKQQISDALSALVAAGENYTNNRNVQTSLVTIDNGKAMVVGIDKTPLEAVNMGLSKNAINGQNKVTENPGTTLSEQAAASINAMNQANRKAEIQKLAEPLIEKGISMAKKNSGLLSYDDYQKLLWNQEDIGKFLLKGTFMVSDVQNAINIGLKNNKIMIKNQDNTLWQYDIENKKLIPINDSLVAKIMKNDGGNLLGSHIEAAVKAAGITHSDDVTNIKNAVLAAQEAQRAAQKAQRAAQGQVQKTPSRGSVRSVSVV